MVAGGIRFYYVPVSVETIGLNLNRELLDDMEVYTTYENPLQNPLNRMIKRTFDIGSSLVSLIRIWCLVKERISL